MLLFQAAQVQATSFFQSQPQAFASGLNIVIGTEYARPR